jgi:hypothetical protein
VRELSSAGSWLRRLAWLNVGLHLLGLVVAGLWMRPGSPLVGLEQRRAHLVQMQAEWALAWGVWALCGLALVLFVAAAGHFLPDRRDLTRLALALGAAAVGVDWLCDGVQMCVLPALAARGPEAEAVFLAFERAAGVGGLVAANGLYGLATLALTLAVPGRPTRALGGGSFGGAMVMVAAGLTDDTRLAALATVPTILLYCAWSLVVAYTLAPGRSR